MNCVFDACAMIAYLRDENGADVVESILLQPLNQCFAHAINLCEVYYDFLRVSDVRTARAALRDLTHAGIRSRPDMNRAFWTRVGEIKGLQRRVSLADCFAIELSRRLDAQVVTSDRHEVEPLAAAGLCRVRFIR